MSFIVFRVITQRDKCYHCAFLLPALAGSVTVFVYKKLPGLTTANHQILRLVKACAGIALVSCALFPMPSPQNIKVSNLTYVMSIVVSL